MFKLIKLCQGNPGAINFLLSAYDINEARTEAIFQRILQHRRRIIDRLM